MASITCEGGRMSPPTSVGCSMAGSGCSMACSGCSGAVSILGSARRYRGAAGVPLELGDKPEEALAAWGKIWMLVGATSGAKVISVLCGSPGQGGGSDN